MPAVAKMQIASDQEQKLWEEGTRNSSQLQHVYCTKNKNPHPLVPIELKWSGSKTE